MVGWWDRRWGQGHRTGHVTSQRVAGEGNTRPEEQQQRHRQRHHGKSSLSLTAPGLYTSTQLFNEEPNFDFRSSEFHEADVFILRIERFVGFLWRTLLQLYLNLFLCSLAGIDDVGGSWKSRGWRKVADLSSFIQFIIPEMEIKTWLDKWNAFIFYFSAHLWLKWAVGAQPWTSLAFQDVNSWLQPSIYLRYITTLVDIGRDHGEMLSPFQTNGIMNLSLVYQLIIKHWSGGGVSQCCSGGSENTTIKLFSHNCLLKCSNSSRSTWFLSGGRDDVVKQSNMPSLERPRWKQLLQR